MSNQLSNNQQQSSNDELYWLSQKAKQASQQLANVNSQQKNQALSFMAELLLENQQQILQANEQDLIAAQKNQLSNAIQDRLMLNSERIQAMSKSLQQIRTLEDPIGDMAASQLRPNGIRVSKMRIPLGVILMIYEARPNVAVEAAALTLKSGNAVILRGGKEAFYSNQALIKCWQQALKASGFAEHTICMVPSQQHSAINSLLQFNDTIDLVIPRGGEKLIKAVSENSKIPVIQHYKGICHIYVDKHADLEKAKQLLIDGKTSRPGVCNALETLIVHKGISSTFLPMVKKISQDYQLNLVADESSLQYFAKAQVANKEDYATEYLDLVLNVKTAHNYQDAIKHIQNYSSNHTEVIVTEHIDRANDFIKQINSSVVMVNASSRFSDGGELGLGAEIGISTSKLHAYGPMGLQQLTTEKYIVIGQGQTRH